MSYRSLQEVDEDVFRVIRREAEIRSSSIGLIASENWVSRAILEAQASVFNNKTAEGYPGRRYFPGCSTLDEIELLAIERAKKLFRADHANVQPHSGTQANMAVYHSILSPGDTILGMRLDQGGHLSHGYHLSFSGKIYKAFSYGVERNSETIDFVQVSRLAKEHKPKIIVAGGSAYPRTIPFEKFREAADENGALLMADIAHIAGLVAGEVHPNPFPHADFVTMSTFKTLPGPRGGIAMCKSRHAKDLDRGVFPGVQGSLHAHAIVAKAVMLKEALDPTFSEYVNQVVKNARKLAEILMQRGYRMVSGGTDTHLLLVDVSRKGLTGKAAESALEGCGIHVNRNSIPFDEKPPMMTSGIRIGTSSVTTRGMKESEMLLIGEIIDQVLSNPEDKSLIERKRSEVAELAARFPLFVSPSSLVA
jgi:glycine hydroxymethyltransferase